MITKDILNIDLETDTHSKPLGAAQNSKGTIITRLTKDTVKDRKVLPMALYKPFANVPNTKAMDDSTPHRPMKSLASSHWFPKRMRVMTSRNNQIPTLKGKIKNAKERMNELYVETSPLLSFCNRERATNSGPEAAATITPIIWFTVTIDVLYRPR